MPLTYEQDLRLKALAPVLDEHAEWFGRVMRALFYPGSDPDAVRPQVPESFAAWLKEAIAEDSIQKEFLDRIGSLHVEMINIAEVLMEEAEPSGAKPEIKKFDSFIMLYEEFLAHIRRLEMDMASSASGIDSATGLRSKQLMRGDIERELERLSRRGKPFCLALARIDHYGHIKKSQPQKIHDSMLVQVSDIIKLCIRNFDDAYHLGDGEFLMCLKQAEIAGGTASLNRLKRLLEERGPTLSLSDKEYRVTMSSCVAEPQPGDYFDDLIANMRKDLDRFGGGSEAALEYLDISPLQRFVKDLDE